MTHEMNICQGIMSHTCNITAESQKWKKIFCGSAVCHRSYLVPYRGRELDTLGIVPSDVDDASVLDVGLLAYAYALDIASEHAVVPDGGISTDVHVADNRGGRRDEGARCDLRRDPLQREGSTASPCSESAEATSEVGQAHAVSLYCDPPL